MRRKSNKMLKTVYLNIPKHFTPCKGWTDLSYLYSVLPPADFIVWNRSLQIFCWQSLPPLLSSAGICLVKVTPGLCFTVHTSASISIGLESVMEQRAIKALLPLRHLWVMQVIPNKWQNNFYSNMCCCISVMPPRVYLCNVKEKKI